LPGFVHVAIKYADQTSKSFNGFETQVTLPELPDKFRNMTSTTEKQILLDLLNLERSKKHIAQIVNRVCQSGNSVDALMEIFLDDHPRNAELSAWVVGDLGQKHPEMFVKWLPQLIEVLNSKNVHGSLKRNALRILEKTNIPDEHLDAATDVCFRLLADPFEEVAIRAFSMGVLWQSCERVPELWPELRLILEENMPHATPAFVNRAQKMIAKFRSTST